MMEARLRDGSSFSVLHHLEIDRVALSTLRQHIYAIRVRTTDVNDFLAKLFEPNPDQLCLLGHLYNSICDLYCIAFHTLDMIGFPKEIAIYRSSDLELMQENTQNWWLLHHVGRSFVLQDSSPLRSFCAGSCPSTCFFLSTFNNGRGDYNGSILLKWMDDVVPTLH